MTWFSYKKINESSLSYPFVKRSISKFTPNDPIDEGTWLFVDVKGLDIDKYYDQSLNLVLDPSSYIVVYEDDIDGESNVFIPVECVINNNILYFKTAEYHGSGIEIPQKYSIYYRTPNIRYIVPVGSSFQVTTVGEAAYNADLAAIDLTTYQVELDSNYSYGFSFVNAAYDWNNGLSKTVGAKSYFTFTGPSLEIYGSKGTDYGKFKLKIVSYGNQATPESSIVLDWVTIDCYNSYYSANELLFSTSGLPSGKCTAELELISDYNILSSDRNIKLNSYQFSYYIDLTLGSEELTEQATFVSLGSLR